MGRKSNYTLEKEKLAATMQRTIQEEAAKEFFHAVLKEAEEHLGELSPIQMHMVLSCAIAKEIEIRLSEDIRRRGVFVETKNGRQIIQHENRSITGVRKQQEEILKILTALGLAVDKKNGKKKGQETDAPEEDDFDRF